VAGGPKERVHVRGPVVRVRDGRAGRESRTLERELPAWADADAQLVVGGDAFGLVAKLVLVFKVGQAAGLEGVLLTSFNGRALDGTLAGYCRAAKGLESGDSVDAKAIVAPGGAPKRVTLEME